MGCSTVATMEFGRMPTVWMMSGSWNVIRKREGKRRVGGGVIGCGLSVPCRAIVNFN